MVLVIYAIMSVSKEPSIALLNLRWIINALRGRPCLVCCGGQFKRSFLVFEVAGY